MTDTTHAHTAAKDADRIREALGSGPVTVPTGAGISTDSGVPDHRGPDSPPRMPMTYQEFVGNAAFRRRYWARNHVGWRHVERTRPNDGHLARRAVSGREEPAVRLSALNPGFAEEVADAVLARTEHFRVADCVGCGGTLKSDIVHFGENVPKPRVMEAYAMVESAASLLVVGSSLTVFSGRRFVKRAVAMGRPVVIPNRGATRCDDTATLTLDHGCSPVLRSLADTHRV